MRLIEPDQITKMMSDLYISEDAVNMIGERQGLWVRFRAIEKAVSEIPTIDAVEVVRCRNCEYWKCNPNTKNYGVCRKVSYDDFEVVMDSDDYCSYGVRREDGKLNNLDDSLLTEKSEVADTYIAGVVWGYNRGVKDCERGLQLSPKTSTTPKEESITIQTGQTYGKSAYVAGDPDTDLISRQGVIDAIEGTVWYRINKNGEMVSGSTNEHESWYKHDDIMIILKTIPSPPVTHDKRTETHGVCSDCINRADTIQTMCKECEIKDECKEDCTEIAVIKGMPTIEDMGEVSDGYHTFNQLYHQRAVLFATIVNQNKDKAWKSWKHEDDKFCFNKEREWFIVGVDTPEGSYTYHYEKKYWNMFNCKELDRGKHWDGHTEEDVTRLLSLPLIESKRPKGKWVDTKGGWRCTACNKWANCASDFCPNCGYDHRGDKE